MSRVGVIFAVRMALVISAVTVSAVASHAAAKQKTATQGTSRTDFYGAWERVGSLNFDPTIPGNLPDHPPLTPKSAAQFQASIDSAAAGKPINDPHATCVPLGMPRMMNMVYLMEILLAKDKVTIVAEEESQIRRIWIDGRGIPDDIYPTYNGFSYGHWEGDTLVAHTVGMRPDTPINGRGLYHSDQLIVDERIWLQDHNTVKDQLTLTDPETFTKPWVVTKTYKRTTDPLHEYVCEENNRNPVGADGVTGVIIK